VPPDQADRFRSEAPLTLIASPAMAQSTIAKPRIAKKTIAKMDVARTMIGKTRIAIKMIARKTNLRVRPAALPYLAPL